MLVQHFAGTHAGANHEAKQDEDREGHDLEQGAQVLQHRTTPDPVVVHGGHQNDQHRTQQLIRP